MNDLLFIWHRSQLFIDTYNFHIINCLFIFMFVVTATFGGLLSLFEAILPTFIKQTFRYGKHCYKGKMNEWTTFFEIPKSCFAHFYVFAFGWSLCALCLILKTIIKQETASWWILEFLDFVAGGTSNRKVLITTNQAFKAAILMTLQCSRRVYETNFIQIFSKKSKINLIHYIVGYLHYFGCILALLINTKGFIKGSLPSHVNLFKITITEGICIFLFYFAWTQQWKANIILVNLRKDAKTGKIKTEDHLIPTDGFFQLISSPHMFFEIVMYVVLCGILQESLTWKLIVIWVVINQVINAFLVHQWYKENFKNYPKQRKILLPFVF